MHDPADLTADLVRIPSVSGEESVIGEYLVDVIRSRLEFDVLELQEVTPQRFNVVMRRGSPRLSLTSHMDTVPTSVPLKFDNRAIFGTGACDAKAQVAVQICALERAVEAGLRDYACFYVVGEEVDGDGARKVIEHPAVGGDFALNGEPTSNRFASSSWGVVELIARGQGTAAHSSITSLDSAVHKLVSDLSTLLSADDPRYSVNVGRIFGGNANNVIAAEAEAGICLRASSPYHEIRTNIEELVSNVTLQIVDVVDPFAFYVPAEYLKDAVDVRFSTDSPRYSSNFSRGLLLGPGNIRDAHSESEFVLVEELHDAVTVLTAILMQYNR